MKILRLSFNSKHNEWRVWYGNHLMHASPSFERMRRIGETIAKQYGVVLQFGRRKNRG